MDEIRELAQYVIETGCTVRSAASVFGVSKSTVHKELTKRLRDVSPKLFEEVAAVLKKNKDERHIRGGMATRNKYIEGRHKNQY